MTEPLVTIGITAFNARLSIERAVRSALAQRWRPIEIVAVDDASTDGTFEALVALAAQHPELRVFRQAVNGGVAAARNRIIAEARGEFVGFFDDDDESNPERIHAQVERLVAYEREHAGGAPVVCHTARLLRYPDGSERLAPTMGEDETLAAPHGLAVARRVLAGAPLQQGYGSCATCSQLARLELYRSLGGFDPAFRRAEDTEFCIRLAKAGGHFVGLAAPLVLQTMTATADKSVESEHFYAMALLEKHRDVLGSEAGYRFAREWLTLKHQWLARRRASFGLGLARLALTHPVRTVQRLVRAAPNAALNRAFRHFHSVPKT